ncbi:MAG: gamma-glutamyltransferase, partial [Methylobacterium mesophilicum]|nr:gamma-glutamyltransferase [Methylobacterium mesophilicum]
EAQRGGGVITPDDFHAYRPMVQRPVTGTYRDFELIGSPPPDDGGVQLIEAFNMLERLELWRREPASNDFETLRQLIRVHNEIYYAPPRQGDLDTAPDTLALLLSKEHAAHRLALMANDEPRATGRVIPTPGTIHISVIDSDRNVASCTHSHMASAWVNRLFAEGFQLSGGGSFFQRILPQPGARATVYLAPTIVLENGRPVIVAGSPSVSLVACILQNLVNMMDFGMSVAQSVHEPRFGARPHTPARGWEPGTTLESGFAPEIQRRFLDWTAERRLWGKTIHPRSVLTGNFEGIMIDGRDRLHSCADPRRVGLAAGY